MKKLAKYFNKIAPRVKPFITIENWTLLLLVAGLPLVGLIYADIRLAFAVFCVVNIIIGVLYLRKDK